MKSDLIAMLGLPETATEDQIKSAVANTIANASGRAATDERERKIAALLAPLNSMGVSMTREGAIQVLISRGEIAY